MQIRICMHSGESQRLKSFGMTLINEMKPMFRKIGGVPSPLATSFHAKVQPSEFVTDSWLAVVSLFIVLRQTIDEWYSFHINGPS